MQGEGSRRKSEFYAKYRLFIENQWGAEKAIPHYGRHLRRRGEYLRKALREAKGRENPAAGPEHVAVLVGWLREFGGNPHLEDWQIRQAEDAVRLAHAGL